MKSKDTKKGSKMEIVNLEEADGKVRIDSIPTGKCFKLRNLRVWSPYIIMDVDDSDRCEACCLDTGKTLRLLNNQRVTPAVYKAVEVNERETK